MNDNVESTFQKDLQKFKDEIKKRKERIKKFNQYVTNKKETSEFRFMKLRTKREQTRQMLDYNIKQHEDKISLNHEKMLKREENASIRRLNQLNQSIEKTIAFS